MLDVLATWAQAGAWGYLAVALGAALPWLEILVVIPPAIALGLDPAVVGVVALLGNALPVVAIVEGYERLDRWSRVRRGRPLPGADGRRGSRGRRVLARYGVPGLALLGPLLTGVHLAVVVMLASGGRPRRALLWTSASLAAWTVAIVALSVVGVDAVAGDAG